uniref:Uncharacterized protein n=1 Tax=Arundo donax TaxID=35708 RepID=A0A0A9HLC1_ARUDO
MLIHHRKYRHRRSRAYGLDKFCKGKTGQKKREYYIALSPSRSHPIQVRKVSVATWK